MTIASKLDSFFLSHLEWTGQCGSSDQVRPTFPEFSWALGTVDIFGKALCGTDQKRNGTAAFSPGGRDGGRIRPDPHLRRLHSFRSPGPNLSLEHLHRKCHSRDIPPGPVRPLPRAFLSHQHPQRTWTLSGLLHLQKLLTVSPFGNAYRFFPGPREPEPPRPESFLFLPRPDPMSIPSPEGLSPRARRRSRK